MEGRIPGDDGGGDFERVVADEAVDGGCLLDGFRYQAQRGEVMGTGEGAVEFGGGDEGLGGGRVRIEGTLESIRRTRYLFFASRSGANLVGNFSVREG